jgi:hypothetical protein
VAVVEENIAREREIVVDDDAINLLFLCKTVCPLNGF